MNQSATSTATFLACEIWVSAAGGKAWELVQGNHNAIGPERPEGVWTAGSCPLDRAVDSRKPTVDGPVLCIPLVDHGSVSSVIRLVVAEDRPVALESWSGAGGEHELSLKESFHPGLTRFNAISQHVYFPHGSGLPGRAWATGAPQLIGDLATAPGFLRSTGASAEGLGAGLALPVIDKQVFNGVALLLSGINHPFYGCAEIWRPIDGRLELVESDHGRCPAVAEASGRMQVQPGDGPLGRAWAQRRPHLVELSPETTGRHNAFAVDGLSHALTIPTFIGEDCRAVTLLAW
jgi:hypothetical protein